MLSEEESIQCLFEKNFASFKLKRVVLYGDSDSIRVILKTFSDFSFCGIILSDSSQKTIGGRKVCSFCLKMNN